MVDQDHRPVRVHVVHCRRYEQHVYVFQSEMFFGEHGIARMKETLAADVEYVPAIVRDLLDKVRLACEHREFLVAMDGVYRLDVDALHVERLQWLGDRDALSCDTPLAHLFQTR